MGSTSMRREIGMTDREFFELEFPEALTRHGSIAACASMPARGEWNRVFYAAVTNTPDAPSQPGVTWCLVILMHRHRNPSTYYNFTFKTLSDTAGPVVDNCPDRILDLLSPTDNKYAVEWRAACRAHNARVAKSRALANGAIIRFSRPLPFGEPYGEADRFRYVKEGRAARFYALDESGAARFRCRIQGWRSLAFTVESA